MSEHQAGQIESAGQPGPKDDDGRRGQEKGHGGQKDSLSAGANAGKDQIGSPPGRRRADPIGTEARNEGDEISESSRLEEPFGFSKTKGDVHHDERNDG